MPYGARLPGTPRVHSCKQSIYLPETMLAEIVSEARRQGRSVSWTIQEAWRRAGSTLKALPPAAAPEAPCRTK